MSYCGIGVDDNSGGEKAESKQILVVAYWLAVLQGGSARCRNIAGSGRNRGSLSFFF
jgi:hypothetical protein